MLRYKINKISEVETDLLSEFYKKTYQKRHNSLTNNWRWWYRVGYNEFEPIVISVDNKIIGLAGLLPIDLNILGKKTSLPNYVKKILISTINKTKNNPQRTQNTPQKGPGEQKSNQKSTKKAPTSSKSDHK